MEKSDSVTQYGTSGRPDLKSMSIEELKGLLTDMGEKSFRASQLFKWMHSELESDIDHMTDLPKSLREKLKETCTYTVIKQVREQVSKIDGTRKYLWELDDGNRIESVRMGYRHGSSVCISSQAGCAMGCAFCASAIGGLDRSLTPAEMLEQVYRISAIDGERVKNVVVMLHFQNSIRRLTRLLGERKLRQRLFAGLFSKIANCFIESSLANGDWCLCERKLSQWVRLEGPLNTHTDIIRDYW